MSIWLAGSPPSPAIFAAATLGERAGEPPSLIGRSERARTNLTHHCFESHRAILKRLKAGVASGELAAHTDVRAMAQFYMTFAHGISIQARDGATRASLMAAVDCAMAAWDSLAGAH
jgi:hypothetical protein